MAEQLVIWDHSKDLSTILHDFGTNGDYDGTAETIRFQLDGDCTQNLVYTGDQSWGLLPNSKKIIIDLNGYKFTTNGLLPNYGAFNFTEMNVTLYIYIENGSIVATRNLLEDVTDTGGNTFSGTSHIHLRKLKIKITPEINPDFGHNLGSYFEYVGMYNCELDIVGDYYLFYNGSVNFPELIIEDCFSTYRSIYSHNHVISYKRNYIYKLAQMSHMIDNEDIKDGTYGPTNGNTLLGNNGDVTFTTDNFYEIHDTTHPLYLVPKPDSVLANPSDQSSHQNIIGEPHDSLNGIIETNGTRTVGPFGVPIVLEKPTDITITRNDDDIDITWTDTTLNTSLIAHTVILVDEFEGGDYETILATLDFGTNAKNFLYTELPNNGNCFIKLKYTID